MTSSGGGSTESNLKMSEEDDILPYQFEPELSQSSSDTDHSDMSESYVARLQDASWLVNINIMLYLYIFHN